jgi:essential nuclear protein 1
LIYKKYALPYRVIDGLVHHFVRFITDRRDLPVLWHQALLVFVQNYKQDLSAEQKEAILEVIKIQQHYQITPAIRTEIFKATPRDEEITEKEALVDEDDDDNDGHEEGRKVHFEGFRN